MSQTGWILFLALFASTALAQVQTPDYWRCLNKVNGSWDFGRVPYACDASSFGEDHYLLNTYPMAIYNDLKRSTPETKRYMQSVYSLVKDTAVYYLKERNPQAASEEIRAWTHAALTIAHQETYFSHYRKATDGRIKIIRGDSGHGHGIMQLDDRWHYVDINSGKAWNLITNLVYAFEEYYADWVKALKAPCFKQDPSWRNRARSAYSAYNGGIGNICRWKNPQDDWARNDIAFAQKYDASSWELYVDNLSAPSPIDVACLVEGRSNCTRPNTNNADSPDQTSASQTTWQDGQVIMLPDGRVCVYYKNQFHCVESSKDRLCLQKITPINENSSTDIEIGSESMRIFSNYRATLYDRHQLCLKVESLYKVGDVISTQQEMNLQSKPGEGILTTIPKDTQLQVLDFDIRSPNFTRYYKVSYQGVEGYIYGGNASDNNQWALLIQKTNNTITNDDNSALNVIPTEYSKMIVKAPNGITLRETPMGKKITFVQTQSTVIILETLVRKSDNYVFYKVQYGDNVGYIYSGKILPNRTTNEWLVPVLDNNNKGLLRQYTRGQLVNTLWYDYLLDCQNGSCKTSGESIVGPRMQQDCEQSKNCHYQADQFNILDENTNGMSKIQLDKNGRIGFIPTSHIEKI